jgi:hypothetical protein
MKIEGQFTLKAEEMTPLQEATLRSIFDRWIREWIEDQNKRPDGETPGQARERKLQHEVNSLFYSTL